jgi:hypothetical protein
MFGTAGNFRSILKVSLDVKESVANQRTPYPKRAEILIQ